MRISCIRYNLISVLWLLLFIFKANGQGSNAINNLIQQYVKVESYQEKYDLLQGMMEANAKLSMTEAKNLSSKLKSKSSKEGEAIFLALGNLVLADVLFYKNHIDSSIYYYTAQGLSSELAGDYMLASFGYGNAAYCLESKGKLGEALLYREKALPFVKLSGDDRVLADTYFNMGNLYSKLNKPDSSSLYLKKAIALDRKNNNIQGMVHNLAFLIDQFIKGENYEEAELLCKECINHSRDINYLRGLAMCYHLYALSDFYSENLKQALEGINLAIEIDLERKDDTRKGQMLRTKAMITEKYDVPEAVELYEQSILAHQSRKDVKGECSTSLALAKLYLTQESFEKCEEVLDGVKLLIEKFDIKALELDYLELRYSLEDAKGEHSTAIGFLEMKNQLLLAKVEDLVESQTAQLSSGFELFKAEKELTQLEFEKELIQLKNKRRRNIFVIFGLFMILSTLISYFAFQNQKNRNVVFQKSAEEEKLKLNLRLLEKEMDALRSQMNPHFLFNSLNSINDYIMHADPKLASTYLAKFSKLMRTILNNSKSKFVSISDEINAISLYLEMEKLRFKNKFSFEINISPTFSTAHLLIPSMLIQPYVENAVKHGMMNLKKKGLISINVHQQSEGRLEIVVEDNGIGRQEARLIKMQKDGRRKSLGHEITNNRIELLNQIYNVDAKLTYKDLENPTGTEVLISLIPISKSLDKWTKLELS